MISKASVQRDLANEFHQDRQRLKRAAKAKSAWLRKHRQGRARRKRKRKRDIAR